MHESAIQIVQADTGRNVSAQSKRVGRETLSRRHLLDCNRLSQQEEQEDQTKGTKDQALIYGRQNLLSADRFHPTQP